MENFSIKKATKDDFGTIIDLAVQIWEPTYGHILSKEQLDYMFERTYTPTELARQEREGQDFFILHDKDKPLAYASFSCYSKEPLIYKLNKIYVLPETQGKGVGRELLGFMEKEAQQLGATALQLCVNRYNKAKGFYEKLGYILLREEDFPFDHYWMNDFVLQKKF